MSATSSERGRAGMTGSSRPSDSGGRGGGGGAAGREAATPPRRRGGRGGGPGRVAPRRAGGGGPVMRSPLCLWSAGGRQLPHAASPERPVLAPAVLRRIVASDGWIARPTSLPSQISEDLAEIRQALAAAGRDPGTFTVA